MENDIIAKLLELDDTTYSYEDFNVFYKYPNILFGASGSGQLFLTELTKLGIKIKYFCDNDINKHGQYLNGIKILSLEELINITKKHKINIIISSNYYNEIYTQLKNIKIKANIYRGLMSDYNILKDMKNMNYHEVIELVENINKLKCKLKDDSSKIVIGTILNYLFTFETNFIEKIYKKEKNQYFIDEVIPLVNNGVIVDCGAYIGDTIDYVINNLKLDINHIYAFEVAEKNLYELENNIKKWYAQDKITIIKKGVWNRTEKMYIKDNFGEGVKVTENKTDFPIEMCAIDEVLNKVEKINFIKMDVEGSELNALKGAEKTILKNRPILAICIYHSLKEFYSIPFYLMDLLKDYNFIIRHHLYRVADTIIYCIPKY